MEKETYEQYQMQEQLQQQNIDAQQMMNAPQLHEQFQQNQAVLVDQTNPKKIVKEGNKEWEIPCSQFKGDIHISEEEKKWMSQLEEQGVKEKFWIIMAGGKYDFTAKWNNPKTYQEVVDHFKGKIKFGKVNVDDAQELSQKFKISSIPNIILFKDGKIVERFVGSKSADDFEDALKEFV